MCVQEDDVSTDKRFGLTGALGLKLSLELHLHLTSVDIHLDDSTMVLWIYKINVHAE